MKTDRFDDAVENAAVRFRLGLQGGVARMNLADILSYLQGLPANLLNTDATLLIHAKKGDLTIKPGKPL